jgi:hypothetical protein
MDGQDLSGGAIKRLPRGKIYGVMFYLYALLVSLALASYRNEKSKYVKETLRKCIYRVMTYLFPWLAL